MAKITRILIKDFRSIRKLELDPVPKKGVIVKGKNAKGKTSFIDAIRAAIAAQGITEDNIRHGEDRAEIQVDIDALLKVRRTITANSSQVTVTTKEGDRWTKPQGRLHELLGTAGIDPLAFFLADQKDRRRQVIEAMPLTVDVDRMLDWIGPEYSTLVENMGVEGHALDVVERYRKLFYDRRTEANQLAKSKRAAVDAAADAAAAAPRHENALAPADAYQKWTAARARADELRGRQAAAGAARAAGDQTRARIASLKAGAEDDIAKAPPEPSAAERAAAEARREMAAKQVAELERQLTGARQVLVDTEKVVAGFETAITTRQAFLGNAERLRSQAADLQEALDRQVGPEITEEEIAQAAADVEYAQRAHQQAEQHAAALVLDEQTKAARAAARTADDAAEVLDGIVKKLTVEAPRLLVAQANVIPGLAFDGDKILMNGTPIDGLSGAEQMKFSVELARQLNARARILVVDGLERLDGESLERFIKMATADDFQLFATKVENGDLVIDAIEV